MEPKELNLVLRDYRAEGTSFEVNLGRKSWMIYQRSDTIGDYVEHRLTLKPVKRFLVLETMTMGVDSSDLSMVGKGSFFDEVRRFIGEKGYLGRIYHKGKCWFYLHEVKPPEAETSGLLAVLEGKGGLQEGLPVLLEPGEKISFRLQLRKYGELKTTDLATIEIV